MKKWLVTLASLLDVRPGEGVLVLVLLAHAFCNGLCITFFETAANSFFLSHFEASALPYVYIATAVFSTLIGIAYTRLESRLTPAVLLKSTLVFEIISIGLLYGLMHVFAARWTTGLLMVWKDINWVLLNLEFWAVAGLLFNVRQGKRLFGLVISGEIAALMLGGLSISAIVDRVGTLNLLAAAGLGALGSLALLIHTLRLHTRRGIDAQKTSPHEPLEMAIPAKRSIGELLKDRYLQLFFTVSVLTYLVFYIVDVAFYEQLEIRHKDAATLAGFFGLFYAVLGFVNLLCSTLLSGPLLTRYGLSVGLLTLPVGVALFATSAAIAFRGFHALGAFFWLIVATKFMEDVGRSAFQIPAYRILYQALPTAERLKVQALRESVIEPVAIGLSGVLLVLLTSVFSFTAIHLTYTVLGLLGLWLWHAARLRNEYTRALTANLARRKIGGQALSALDASSLAVLQSGVRSPHAGQVIYCLNTLEEAKHPGLSALFVNSLDHPDAQVRVHALESLERHGLPDVVDIVSRYSGTEKSPEVKGVALRTVCALAKLDALERVESFLESPEMPVRRGVMIGLLRNGGIDGVRAAGAGLNALLLSPDPCQRILATEILGGVATASFSRPLVKLLEDADAEVRRAALKAAGKVKHANLIPPVLKAIGDPKVRDEALAALVAFGDAVISDLETAFGDKKRGEKDRVRMCQVCGRIGTKAAMALMLSCIESPSPDLRHAVLRSLVKAQFIAQPGHAELMRQRLHAEAQCTLTVLAALEDLGSNNNVALLRQALEYELVKSRDRILLLLALFCPARAILKARVNFASCLTERRAQALEIVDNALPQEIKAWVIPLLDDIPPAQCLIAMAARHAPERMSPGVRIGHLMHASQSIASAWMSACAVYTAARVQGAEVLANCEAALRDPRPMVRATAEWTLQNRGQSGRATIETGAPAMLLTIEKVIILKSVNIFAEVPDEELAEISGIMEVIEVPGGEAIIKKGDLGTSMYIIIEGKARVHNESEEFAVLGARQIFGELAALDPEPRAATVTALETTQLFRLEREPFLELMAENPGVTQRILRVLCQRLRMSNAATRD